MGQTLPGIIYETENGSKTIDSPNSLYTLEFEKSAEYMSNQQSRNRFITKTKQLIRRNDRYTKYIAKLKTKKKLNRCQILSNLTDKDCSIEMHHGPIFTLHDYCDIMIDHFLSKGWEITTYDIADIILDEHWKDRIQVVMCSTTVHQEIHDREIFLNMLQAYGNLHKFLKIYKLNEDLLEKYNRYVDKCRMLDSTSYEMLQINEKIFQSYK